MTAAPVSLYFQIDHDKHVDLEVVARTSLALSATIKEIAFVLDPSEQISIEFLNGTEGSLFLNTIVRSLKPEGKLQRHVVGAIVAVSLIIGEATIGWGVSTVLDRMSQPDLQPVTATLSDQEKVEIAQKVVSLLEKGVAKEQQRQIFREIEGDPQVKGIGITTSPSTYPTSIVPQSDFSTRAMSVIEDQEKTTRLKTHRLSLVLISPVLADSKNQWRFQTALAPITASMRDRVFIDKVVAGTLGVPLRAGLIMTVDLETVERFEDGVWKIKERRILKVIGVTEPNRQASLPSAF